MYGQKSVLRREYAFFMERKWKVMTIEDKGLFLNIDKQKTDSLLYELNRFLLFYLSKR